MSSGPAPGAFALALVAAVALATCQPELPDAEPTPGPVGGEVYERLLSEGAGAPCTAFDLVALARAAYDQIGARMDSLAASIDGVDDWRPVFKGLLEEHPSDVDSLLAAYQSELERSADFVRERQLVTLPPAAPKVVELANPVLRATFPLALYRNDQLAVTTASGESEDPAYLVNHCWACIPPLAVHEGYPGHHVAFFHMDRGTVEATSEGTSDIRPKPGNRYLVEGWGLYAELLMLEQGYYSDPKLELAAWRMLQLRALRAWVDPLLHTGELPPAEAERLYREELLMSSEAAASEVRRHLAEPTMKVSYFVGLVQILELRESVMARGELRWREFHDRLLGHRTAIPQIAHDAFGIELGRLGNAKVPWPSSGAMLQP